jgi:hypothetical protein
VRADREQFRSEIESTGFGFVEERDFMRGQFFHRYRKLEAAAGEMGSDTNGAF